MKKMTIALILIIALLATACAPIDLGAGDGSIDIVCTTFAEYDWLRNLTVGVDNVKLSLLVDAGIDLHSYQPTADDVVKIAAADMFVYVGGVSDGWVADAVKEAVNKEQVVVNLMTVLGDRVKPTPHQHGDADGDHDHAADGDHDHTADGYHDHAADGDHNHVADGDHNHSEQVYQLDEHIWLSLKNAQIIVRHLTDKLVEIDPDNALIYGQNSAHYLAELLQLDEQYQQTIGAAPHDSLIFADRFPFAYLFDDYGLSYYAAFSGCSAETEASFEKVVDLAAKLDQLGLKSVVILEQNDGKMAQTVIDNSATKDAQIYVINSMQSMTEDDFKNDNDYLKIMRDNLTVLQKALD